MDRSRPIKTDPIAAVFRRLKNDELNATVLTLDAELAPASESGRQAAPAEPLARRSTCSQPVPEGRQVHQVPDGAANSASWFPRIHVAITRRGSLQNGRQRLCYRH